jgi:hypothetical protein
MVLVAMRETEILMRAAMVMAAPNILRLRLYFF